MAGALFRDLHCSIITKAKLFCDNQAALFIAANRRTKHIEVHCHNAHTKSQLEDMFTKLIPIEPYTTHLSKLGVLSRTALPTQGGDEV